MSSITSKAIYNKVIYNKVILIDCNNFFVSCERVFNPKLRNKPVVVLSNNDACVIARSNEAKQLGIPMGIPVFKCIDILKRYNVQMLSSNFALYGDMSARIMQTVANLTSSIEVYSIDELFACIPVPATNDIDGYYMAYCSYMKHQIYKHTGIPVSIGIGHTKTLAKVANKIAKKKQARAHDITNNVYALTSDQQIDDILKKTPVEDIWGIGRRYNALLKKYNIQTAYDFKQLPEQWIKKHMTIIGHKTYLELHGTSCLKFEEVSTSKKSMCVSRSFGRTVTSFSDLKEAVSTYAQKAAEKLRSQKSLAQRITVFVMYRPHGDTYKQYLSTAITLPRATAYTPDILAATHICLTKIYKQDLPYKKAGIMLDNFVDQHTVQTTVESVLSADQYTKQQKLMSTIDSINRKLKPRIVQFASSGTRLPNNKSESSQSWQAKAEKKSPAFTTNWRDILTINIQSD